MSGLPPNWVLTTLGDIRRDGSTVVDPQKSPDKFYELYSVPAFEAKLADIVPGRDIGSTKQRVVPGTVLVCKINPRINRVWVVGHQSRNEQIASTEWVPFYPVSGVDPAYLKYYLSQDHFRDYLAANVSGVGGSLMRVRPSVLSSYPLPIAPILEQHRIVDSIESYLSRLDAAIAALARVKRNLARYRASVLHAAVTGRLVLTEAELARSEGREYESASELLARILTERRRRWEDAERAKMAAAGKAPKDDRWKARYAEPVAPETEELGELPEGWCWATVDQLSDVTGGLTKNPSRDALSQRLPYLRVANVYADRLDTSEVSMIGVSVDEMDRLLLRRGDLLVVEGNGSADQIGRVACWDGRINPCVHQNHLIKVRPTQNEMSRWMMCWLLSLRGREQIMTASSSTSGLHTLSLSKVKSIALPLAPLAELQRSVSAIDNALSVADFMTANVVTVLARVLRLRQAILRLAFEGRLVDQSPDDESATVLLERIRAERSASIPTRRGRPRRTEIATQEALQ